MLTVNRQNILGIDPGKNGAIAILQTDLRVDVLRLADATEMDVIEFLRFRTPGIAYIEQVNSSPKMGVVSAFTFGGSYHSLRMAVLCNHLILETVRPQKWRSAIKVKKVPGALGKNDTEKKRATKARAQELFPGRSITHGDADALLLMEFGRLTQGAER